MRLASEAALPILEASFIFWGHDAAPLRSAAVRLADSEQRQIVVDEDAIRGHASALPPSSVLADRADPAFVQRPNDIDN